MKRLVTLLAAAVLSTSAAFADIGSFAPGGSGGGGSGTITSIATACPATGAITSGAVTLQGGLGSSANSPVTAATYTLLANDCGTALELAYTGGAQAITVPQAGSTGFGAGFLVNIDAKSTAGGTITFTTTAGSGVGFSNNGTTTLTLAAGNSLALRSDGTNWNVYSGQSASGTGNVTGPGSSTSGDFATFSGTGGKTLQDSPAGSGVVAALGNATNAAGGVTTQNGSITSGDCLKESSGIADAGGACALGPNHPGYVTGSSYWYPGMFPGINAGTGAAEVVNTIYCSPAYLPSSVTIKALGVDVTTLFSGGHYGAAIYNNSASHRPGTLVDFAAAMSTTTVAQVNGTMNNTTDTIGPGVYWFCGTSDNATSVVMGVNAAAVSGAFVIGSSNQGHVISTAGETIGINCLVSSTTCGGTGSGWGVWSSGVFTWGNATSATWTDSTNGVVPFIAYEVN